MISALQRYADDGGGEQINIIISEALRSYIPQEHLDTALDEFMMEQRRLWAEAATDEERRG